MALALADLEYAIRDGHYEAIRRFHVSKAVLCSLLFKDFALLDRTTVELVNRFGIGHSHRVDAVLSATSCGITMGTFAASYLAQKFSIADARLIRVPVAEQSLETGDASLVLPPQSECLVLFEHALTGRTIAKVIQWARQREAKVLGVGVLCDRRKVQDAIESVPVYAAIDLSTIGYNIDLDREPCPLCEQRVALTTAVRVI